jgi:hypothetical protein
LAESLIKIIKLIARPYCITAICLLPIGDMHFYILLTLFNCDQLHTIVFPRYVLYVGQCGNAPSIFYLRKFGCVVYTPISPSQRTMMGPQSKMGIYIGYHSSSIITYLEPMTVDLFMARYTDCIFNDDHFPALAGGF